MTTITVPRVVLEQALEALSFSCPAPHLMSKHAAAEAALRAALAEPAHTRQLTDDKIGRIWFRLAIPGVTETTARLIIREAEKMMRGEIQ